MTYSLGQFGVWTHYFRGAPHDRCADAASELEDLGFGAIWVPGVAGGEDYLPLIERLLEATQTIVVATGILNIWAHDPEDVARTCARIHERHPDRLLLGLGVSHAQLMPGQYQRPIESMERYLDELDRYDSTGPARRCLAALGPRMLELARDRSLGAHPYNVPAAHSRAARDALGVNALLAPEHAAVLHEDLAAARDIARQHLADYLGRFDNYERSFLRLGFSEDDLRDQGSDRLLDALVACGEPATVAMELRKHLDAGADHVCVQVQPGTSESVRGDWRMLAEALFP